MKVSELLEVLHEAVDRGRIDGDSEVVITDNASRCAKTLTVLGAVDGFTAALEAQSADLDRYLDDEDVEFGEELNKVWLVLGHEHYDDRYTPQAVLETLEAQ